MRPVVLPLAMAPRPEIAGKRAVGPEQLDAVVAVVGHGDAVARRSIGSPIRECEQPLAGAERSELELEGAVGGAEHLYAVVAAVGHDNARAVGRPGDGNRKNELALVAAMPADRECRRAVGVENVDAVLTLVDHGDHAARRGKGDRLRLIKRPAVDAPVDHVLHRPVGIE